MCMGKLKNFAFAKGPGRVFSCSAASSLVPLCSSFSSCPLFGGMTRVAAERRVALGEQRDAVTVLPRRIEDSRNLAIRSCRTAVGCTVAR